LLIRRILNSELTLIYEQLGISPGDIVASGPFFQSTNQRQKGCQVDLMIQTKFNTLYLCEIKFSRRELKAQVIDLVQEEMDRLRLPRGFSIQPVLIHVNGLSERLEDQEFFAHIIDFGQLLAKG